MKFRTLALALALVCGLTVVGEAKQKHLVRPAKVSKSNKAPKVKSGKARKYKANKYKPSKRSVKHAKR